MRRVILLALGIVAIATVAASASASRTERSPICTQHLLPLAANSIGPAARAALRRERASARPRVVSADLATDDHERGPEAKFECSTRVWRRTVVVYITLRAYLPSASLSERVDFVGRFKGGYRVWQVVH
jgi:hypothetical protein